MEPLIACISEDDVGDNSFEEFIGTLLPELIDASAMAQVERLKFDEIGGQIIPMSRLQRKMIFEHISQYERQSPIEALLQRKLLSERGGLRSLLLGSGKIPTAASARTVTPLTILKSTDANPEVIDALYAIRTTPYDISFLRRLQGSLQLPNNTCLAVDWENRTPWMDLMQDVRDHHALMFPEREQPCEVEGFVRYVTLERWHLTQVHNILARAFWAGIDVSDSLDHSPERCTIIAIYKKMVVGVALLSSPQETYITYLAVRPGWDNAQIATSMLYHLISLNPRKDMILHVSINNPAVLLYNRFGFKAEEFIVGFYEDYLDSKSRASKNAFRLRLRR
ncbi:hypothetical protein BDY19DRAFT_605204 [Irpex rosettiformis]|uniref:Uncharacterized protein n=1 Tax=Irpex rosettiformis TaxID=378272 RepID=A0ACB8TPP6_9APHY|nr:hypothetical protein BDY19DRAFT_605204 [Irpex rosettiformis]